MSFPVYMVTGLAKPLQNHETRGGHIPRGMGRFRPPPRNGVPIYILSRARVGRLVGKMALFDPFFDPYWTKNGVVFRPPFVESNGRRKEKRHFTHHEHDPKNDDFVFFLKKPFFAFFAKSRFFKKR
jgi:hypothetical protein